MRTSARCVTPRARVRRTRSTPRRGSRRGRGRARARRSSCAMRMMATRRRMVVTVVVVERRRVGVGVACAAWCSRTITTITRRCAGNGFKSRASAAPRACARTSSPGMTKMVTFPPAVSISRANETRGARAIGFQMKRFRAPDGHLKRRRRVRGSMTNLPCHCGRFPPCASIHTHAITTLPSRGHPSSPRGARRRRNCVRRRNWSRRAKRRAETPRTPSTCGRVKPYRSPSRAPTHHRAHAWRQS
mmetsp:Transcript_3863/g.12994  ORF Transcript_3863/g.12994 Transcript_3863/m.12994 type:complete len:245 (-) Transcript_3863:192-926(-)